jgi:hypothetical protein
MADQPWLKSIVQQRNTHKRSLRPLRVTHKQWECFLHICMQKISWIRWVIGLVMLTTTIELMLPMVLRVFRSFQWYSYDMGTMLWIGLAVFVFATGYIWIQHRILTVGQGVVLHVINTLREHMFAKELKRNPHAVCSTDKGRFISGISYHLSLLQQAIQQLFPKAVVWIGYIIGMTVLAGVLGRNFVALQIGIVIISLVLIKIGYILSSRYVSQHQTMYSALLRFVSESLDERQWVWTAQLQSRLQNTMRSIVEIDTYFRIKRTVWTRLGPTIVVVFLSAILFLMALLFRQSDLTLVAHPVTVMMWGFFAAFGIRLCLFSYQIGFAWFILQLGMVLVVPEHLHTPMKNKYLKYKTIQFSSKKVKFSRQDTYTKSCKILLKPGVQMKVVSAQMPVLHDVMRLMMGYMHAGEVKPWVVRQDGKHISYRKYQESTKVMQICLNVNTEKTYAQWFASESVSLRKVVEQLQSIPALVKYLPQMDVLPQSIHPTTMTPEDSIVLQCIAVCLHRPQMVVINPLVLQSQLPCVDAFVRYLATSYPDMMQMHLALSHTDLPYTYDECITL